MAFDVSSASEGLGPEGHLLHAGTVGAEDYVEARRRSARFALVGCIGQTLLFASVGVVMLCEGLAVPVAAWLTGEAGDRSALWSGSLSAVVIGLIVLLASVPQARGTGRLLAATRGHDRPDDLVDGVNAGRIEWWEDGAWLRIRQDLVEETLLIADLGRAVAEGRIVRLDLRNGRFLFLRAKDSRDARAIIGRLRAARGHKDGVGFLPEASEANWVRANLDALAVHGAGAAINDSVSPFKLPEPFWVCVLIPLAYLYGAYIFLFAGGGLGSWPRHVAPIVGVFALIALLGSSRGAWAFGLPWLTSRNGLVAGHRTGPAAARADEKGIDARWQGRSLRLDWQAVDEALRLDGLLAVKLTTGAVEVIPEPPDFARHWARAQGTSGPWAGGKTVREAEDPAPAARKPWYRRLPIQIAFWVLLFAGISAASSAFAEPVRLPLSAPPGWSEELPVPDWEPDRDPGSRHPLLLTDLQVRLEGEMQHHLHRWVAAASDRTRLEWAGEIEITIDPTSEEIVLHHARTIRQGEVTEHAGLAFEELRRETRLPGGVMDGRLTYRAVVPRVQVGDLVDVSWSVRRRPHIFPGELAFDFTPEAPGPGSMMRRRFLVPVGKPVTARDERVAPTMREANGWREIEWRLEGEAGPEPSDPPPAAWDASHDPGGVTTFRNWAEIAEGLAPAYAPVPGRLPPDLEREIDAIRARSVDPERRVTDALRLVQERVRYLSLSIGAGGWMPRPPDAVWEAGFGDCKDKALLLVSILAALDIEGDVALVESDRGRALPRLAPSPFLFDHAVVRVRSEAGEWFVDPTDAAQGGVGRAIGIGEFAWALPLSVGSDALVPVPLPELGQTGYEVEETYDLQDEGELAAVLTLARTFRGHAADWMRWKTFGEDLGESGREWAEWYADYYPGARFVGPATVEDDLDANVLTLRMRFELPRAGFAEEGLWKEWWHRAHEVEGELKALDEDESLTGAFWVGLPRTHLHRVVLRNLRDVPKAPETERFANELVRFDRSGEAAPKAGTWSREWRVEVLRSVIAPSEEADWREAVELIDDNDHYRVKLGRHLGEVVAKRPVLAGLRAVDLLALLLAGPVLLLLGWNARTGYRRFIEDKGERTAS